MASPSPHHQATIDEIFDLAAMQWHDANNPTNVVWIPMVSQAKSDVSSLSRSSISDVEDIEKDLEKGHDARFQDEDPPNPNIVDFDGPDDTENPMNWKASKKWGMISLVAVITFLTPLASSMFATGVPDVMREFNSTSDMLEGFMLSVYILGFSFGPLIIAPLSEMYGRLPMYHSCSFMFIIFTIAAGLSTSMSQFIVFRFLMGSFGAAPLVLGGGTIADLIKGKHLGTAMAIWIMGPTIGPCVGPIIGGFLTTAKGWRWNFWFVAIVASATFIVSLILMRETSATTILERKTKRLRAETGNNKLVSKLHSGLTPSGLFRLSIVRPVKMFFCSQICFFISLYVAITYAYIYILFTTFTAVFTNTYGWKGGIVGLSFTGIGVGSVIGQFVATYYGNKTVAKHIALDDFKPEHRLYIMAIGGFFMPVGFLIYGWTVQSHTHFMAPLIGTGFIGFSFLIIFMSAASYLVDVFTTHAASAMAASTVSRSLFAALVPLSGQQMYAKLGYGWGNTLLASIACLLIPIPFVLIKYAEQIRTRSTVKL